MLGQLTVGFALVISLSLPMLGVLALVTFIRRGRLKGEGADDFLCTAVLDSLEQVQLRLDVVNARLERLERSVERGSYRLLEVRRSEEAEVARTSGEGPHAGDAR